MAAMRTESAVMGTQQKLDIVSFVAYDTWKDLLIELVEKEKLDPWNIDIAEIVEGYVNAVKELRVMDLRVPANIILAASILLRLKSSMLQIYSEPEETEEVAVGRNPPLVEELGLRLRPPAKRRLTLAELIDALDEAIKITEMRSSGRKDIPIDIPIFIRQANIEEEMDAVYAKIKSGADAENMITLSALLSLSEVDDVLLKVFVPVLFLANKGKVALIQERFFQEVIIKLA